MTGFRMTQALIDSDGDGFRRATQSNFLQRAAQGRVPKPVLSQWLANDRLYVHSYIRCIGRVLGRLQLPEKVPQRGAVEPVARFVSWLTDALVNLRREERFFSETAERYGLDLELTRSGRLQGLDRIETLFEVLGPSDSRAVVLPWLEPAVLFYGTERCYLEAWTWARGQQTERAGGTDEDEDEDGGALREAFIPNWTSAEFVAFVEELGALIDGEVAKEVQLRGPLMQEEVLRRSGGVWRALLRAEETFWPTMSG